jgi:hypothetical protein
MHFQGKGLALHYRWQSIIRVILLIIIIPFIVIGIVIIRFFFVLWSAEACNKPMGTLSATVGQ